MSVDFAHDAVEDGRPRREPCLCAQRSEVWTEAQRDPGLIITRPDVYASLTQAAEYDCAFCDGSGVELVPTPDPVIFNLSNENALVLFAVLGVSPGRQGLVGTLELPEARRALLRARNVDLARYERGQVIRRGGPVFRGDGVIELAPIRAVEGALDAETIRGYVDRFEQLLRNGERRGARFLCWV